MFKTLRQIADALNALTALGDSALTVLEAHASATREGDGLSDRVATLELSRATWEANVEGEMLRADNQFRNARNSEERVRHQKKGVADEGIEGVTSEGEAEILEAYRALGLLQNFDGAGGEEEGVLDMPNDVEVVPRKTLALRSKFGVQ